MTPSELAKVIRSVFGKGFTFEQADQLVKSTIPVRADADTLVIREGDKPQGLLLLLSGKVEVLKSIAGGQPQLVATVEAPSVLGEMSLITDRDHSATIRAVTDCDFRLLTKTQFVRLLDNESLAAYKLIATIAEVMARRLYRMDEKVLELSAKRDTDQPVEELAAFKQKLFSEWSF